MSSPPYKTGALTLTKQSRKIWQAHSKMTQNAYLEVPLLLKTGPDNQPALGTSARLDRGSNICVVLG